MIWSFSLTKRFVALFCAFCLWSVFCFGGNVTLKYSFDSKNEVASVSVPLAQLGLDIPTNWQDYSYLVLEIKSSSAQRFLLGIQTDNGLHEKRTHIFPGAWLRLSVPLEYFREKPKPGSDLAATVNKPLTVGFMHVEGGTVGPLTGVKGLSLKMYTPLNNPVIEIRSVTLAKENPGGAYLGTVPLVDEFGQWNLSDFAGKVTSVPELQKQWKQEDETLAPGKFGYSRYGGYLAHRVDSTGFFKVTQKEGRWWFVDPSGCLFLSLGVDGISAGGGGGYSTNKGLEGVFKEAPQPPVDGAQGAPRMGMSFGQKNLTLRYGADWRAPWEAMTFRRMDAWGLNTLANWSDRALMASGKKAFMIQFSFRISAVAGLQDVYAPDFKQNIDNTLKPLCAQYRNNPWLIGYFTGNEPAWLEQEERVCGLILDGEDTPMKAALKEFLKDGDTPAKRKAFVYRTFRIFLETVNSVMRQYDPNHLNIGIRFGHSSPPADEILAICKDVFDVFSFNTYRLSPNKEYMDYIAKKTGLPLMLGENHFGTVDRGMAPGLVQVADQTQRAVAFRYFNEQGFSHPSLIGTAWFQYTDQGMIGRGDGERYNIGIVDVTDRPYPIVKGIAETAARLYEVHAGKIPPSSQIPIGVRGNEDDLKSRSNQ